MLNSKLDFESLTAIPSKMDYNLIVVLFKGVSRTDMGDTVTMWGIFISLVGALLALDLGVFHKEDREIAFKESLIMSSFYLLIALIFGLWVWYIKGLTGFSEYMTGFLIEKSLALDNIFLISLIFTSLSIPSKYQHRVLFWGILGVIILRAIMIGLGAQILSHFGWVLYIFAILMIITGLKMIFISHKPIDIAKNPLLIWLKKHLNVTPEFDGHKFFVHQKDPKSDLNKLFFTPLFIALIMVEFTDLIFAVDSIPAIFAITQDAYIVYTSNIFAILGLRSLYFALSSIIGRFYYLKYALAVVLIFIGSKIFIADAFGIAKIPPLLSLSITVFILSSGVIYSILRKNQSVHR